MRKIIFFVVAFIVLFSYLSFALGTVVKNDIAFAGSNETASFSILFWSTETQKNMIKVVSAPEHWLVRIEPAQFITNRTTGSEYVQLSGENVAATHVKVYVTPAYDFSEEHIILKSESSPQAGGIVFAQERLFNLTLMSREREIITAGNKTVAGSADEAENEQAAAKELYNIGFIALALFIILLISYMIYRH